MTTLRPDPNGVAVTPSSPLPPLPTGRSSSRPLPEERQSHPPRLGLRAIVVTSCVVPMVAVVSLTSWLALRNGQQAVTEVATELQEEVSDRIQQDIRSFLDTPPNTHDVIAAGIQSGALETTNLTTLESYFWRQIQTGVVPDLVLANPNGDTVGVRQESNGGVVVRIQDGTTQGNQETYILNEVGNRTQRIQRQAYDTLTSPWYQAAIQAGEPTWSEIYPSANGLRPVISAVSPIYNQAGTLTSVIGTELSVETMGQLLQALDIGEAGQALVIEQNGDLVASSTAEAPFLSGDDQATRVTVADSANPLTRATALALLERFGSFDEIATSQSLEFTLDGKRQLVRVSPLPEEMGLGWFVVVTIPAADFMAPITASTLQTLSLGGVAFVVTVLLGVMISRWITRPILQLSRASHAIAQGNLEPSMPVHGVGELRRLGDAFHHMVHQLRQSFEALATTNTELENRVEQRTVALNEQTQALEREVDHLLDIVSAVEDGDLTVTAAVSPTATGLVADTFNRLIERISQIMVTVSEAAEQVGQGTKHVETLAVTMADNARQQVESVDQVQTLMEDVNDLSQGNVSHVTAADQAMADTQASVERGQQEIATVTSDIGVLQQETQQIVGRAQTLTSYAELAAQFVKDQKRIASLTRVLATNASLLSTRASQQQDPSQFAAITREFETIAAQVNDLAVQTNQSLVVLQQRTEQIQTVVSGLNHDVENISQRTDSLTAGIEQSNTAFDQIRSTTGQVATLSQQVTQSSQAIAAAAQTTLGSIREISTIAVATSDQAILAKTQSQTMEQLAQTLLESVARFQLPIQGHPTAADSSATEADGDTSPHDDDDYPGVTVTASASHVDS